MRHSWSISDSPDLPIRAFRKALGKNRPATLEGGKGGAPSAPDPYWTAQIQNSFGKDSALYNKVLNQGNYSNPFGSQNTSAIGVDPQTGAPIFNTQVTANPQLQALMNNQLSQLGANSAYNQNAIGTLGNLQNSLNSLYGQAGNLNSQDARQAGQDAYYRQAASYLDPQFAQQQESLEAKLAAQGLAPGSQAYSNALGNFQRDKSFAYNQAQNQAITQGQQMGLQDLAAQQGILGQQAGMIDQYGNLIGKGVGIGQQGYGNLNSIAQMIPGYTGTGQAATGTPDFMNAANNQYQGQLGQYNARQQSANATTSSLAGLAGIAAMAFF
jgi:hypothetical protein